MMILSMFAIDQCIDNFLSLDLNILSPKNYPLQGLFDLPTSARAMRFFQYLDSSTIVFVYSKRKMSTL